MSLSLLVPLVCFAQQDGEQEDLAMPLQNWEIVNLVRQVRKKNNKKKIKKNRRLDT